MNKVDNSYSYIKFLKNNITFFILHIFILSITCCIAFFCNKFISFLFGIQINKIFNFSYISLEQTNLFEYFKLLIILFFIIASSIEVIKLLYRLFRGSILIKKQKARKR
ncbi:MAG TPA: hypothetical protein DD381_06515 [Lentisphaeria bacterium]|nr:MAG: hypothetical protein A2X47_13265 [Lentisphaerae bacterium GWF2_38_69]HBM15978.1 hypothetical protein [Lentisphaeria bacterium]